MSEAKDGRVRAGARSTSNAGKFRQHDVAETGMPGAMVFGYFLPKQKVARSRTRAEPLFVRRAEKDREVERQIRWTLALAGMTSKESSPPANASGTALQEAGGKKQGCHFPDAATDRLTMQIDLVAMNICVVRARLSRTCYVVALRASTASGARTPLSRGGADCACGTPACRSRA